MLGNVKSTGKILFIRSNAQASN
uniref:Uncharacterized protein n=1 Tax=Arundo donax TaxID=35708 RepID=A0A0A9GR08_ARUDO